MSGQLLLYGRCRRINWVEVLLDSEGSGGSEDSEDGEDDGGGDGGEGGEDDGVLVVVAVEIDLPAVVVAAAEVARGLVLPVKDLGLVLERRYRLEHSLERVLALEQRNQLQRSPEQVPSDGTSGGRSPLVCVLVEY